MTEEPKSTDYHSVTPYLLVPRVSDLAAFVAEAYGAEEKLRLNRSDGSIMHIETRIGDSIIMMGDPMQDLGAMPASLYLSVEDCDAVYEKALASERSPLWSRPT